MSNERIEKWKKQQQWKIFRDDIDSEKEDRKKLKKFNGTKLGENNTKCNIVCFMARQ